MERNKQANGKEREVMEATAEVKRVPVSWQQWDIETVWTILEGIRKG